MSLDKMKLFKSLAKIDECACCEDVTSPLAAIIRHREKRKVVEKRLSA